MCRIQLQIQCSLNDSLAPFPGSVSPLNKHSLKFTVNMCLCPIFFVMYIYPEIDYLSSMTGCLTWFSQVSSACCSLACVKEEKIQFQTADFFFPLLFFIRWIYWSFIDQLFVEDKNCSKGDVNRKLYSIMHAIALMLPRYFSCESST